VKRGAAAKSRLSAGVLADILGSAPRVFRVDALLLSLSWVTSIPLVGACHKDSTADSQPAPSASVVTIGNTLGSCPDLVACENECDGGSADRCRRLAATYAFGEGVEKDEPRAVTLYEHACDMKDPPACLFAGQMHEFAHGVPEDDAAAARLYERACDMSYAAGCYNLAIMVERGRGVPRDRARAGDLYQVVCTAGAKQACDRATEMHAPPDVPTFLDGGALR
jgi:TPR repeat protein